MPFNLCCGKISWLCCSTLIDPRMICWPPLPSLLFDRLLIDKIDGDRDRFFSWWLVYRVYRWVVLLNWRIIGHIVICQLRFLTELALYMCWLDQIYMHVVCYNYVIACNAIYVCAAFLPLDSKHNEASFWPDLTDLRWWTNKVKHRTKAVKEHSTVHVHQLLPTTSNIVYHCRICLLRKHPHTCTYWR